MQRLKDFVGIRDKQYMVSTLDTFDVGLETMVFESENYEVSNWKELYYKHYETEEDAIAGHKETIDNLEECLKEGEKQNWAMATGINPSDILTSILGGMFKNE